MPFPFTCPHCGLDTLVDDEFAGQRGPCAGCGKEITIPHRVHVRVATDDAAHATKSTKPGMIAVIVVLSILAASMVFALLMMLVFPMFQTAQQVVYKSSCQRNLQQIAEALRQYEIEHGTLPPAHLLDPKTNRPMHSWRVLILPQLGAHGIYNRYDFNEPWDGPKNSQLVSLMPDVFACPSDPDAKLKFETSYMVITGPKTPFPGAKATRTADITDGLETTILVAEIPVAGVNWMEPKDLNAGRMQFLVNGGSAGEIGSYHRQGAHAAMADGTVRFITDTFPSDYLQGMSTPQGNEIIPWEVLE